jgi:NTP pyrophosphatase (non-canonical NTP hydrolase)
MDVKALQARLDAFATERGWDELHNPRNLAIALAGEAAMLLDLFRWLTDAQSHRIESEYKRDAAEEAIADLLLHTLRIADKLGIDVERAVAKKLAENDANYPLPVAEPPPAVAAPELKPAPAKQEPPPPAEQKRATPPPAAPVEPAPVPEAAPKPKPLPEAKGAPTPAEPKKAVPPAAPAEPAPEASAPRPAAEPPSPSPGKALPTWLDGIMPARSGAARKKPAAAARPAPEPPPPPAQAVEEVEAAPPPAAAEPVPVESPSREPERYAYLDTDAAKGFVKSLAKRVDSARSDDPLLRELHDEVETLRRTLYSPMPKYSWMGDSLKTIRAVLEEATAHSVGDEIRARDYMAQIDRMLNP